MCCVNCQINWAEVEAIGTWIAGIGTLLAVIVALYLSRRSERRESEVETVKKWNRIYRNMRELQKHLSVLEQGETYITQGTRATGDKMGERAEESSRTSAVLRESLIDELVGSNDISINNKKEIIEAIMPEKRNESTQDIADRAKKIDEVIKRLVRPLADPEIATILGDIESRQN